jgi:hypothetical protein
MAPRHKVTHSTTPTNYRLSSEERRAARLAEIANTQSDLKREAAERRAKRSAEAELTVLPATPEPDQVDRPGPSDSV